MPHPKTWHLSQNARKDSGECSVCHAVRQLHLKDGTVHLHGSRNSPGSYPPAQRSTTSMTSLSDSVASQSQSTVTQTHQAAQSLQSKLEHPSLSGNIIKHIPRSARPHCAAQLATTIKKIISYPEDSNTWILLLNFGEKLLLAPPRSRRKYNIANVMKTRTIEATPIVAVHKPASSRLPARSDGLELSMAVRSKLEDGNIRAAVRIICSDEKPALTNDATLDALRQRHPPTSVDRSVVPDPSTFNAVSVTESDVIKAIRTFPAGSTAGPDGIRPQHLLDLITCKKAGKELVSAITALINLLLEGRCPLEVATVLFGGRLFALQKKSGGVRPIAIGYTWHRLAAKCANNYATSQLGDTLLPMQLGIATPGGCEAAVHATRRYMATMSDNSVLVKLDFRNAFNCLHRDRMLKTVADKIPGLYRFCWLSYYNATQLRFGDSTIWSEEGAQQGDPLGPLLFV